MIADEFNKQAQVTKQEAIDKFIEQACCKLQANGLASDKNSANRLFIKIIAESWADTVEYLETERGARS